MRRAGQQRPVSTRVLPATSTGPVLNIVSRADAPIAGEGPLDVKLLPKVQAIGLVRPVDAELVQRNPQHIALEVAIRQRIESRLHGRVRNLCVCVEEGRVTLEGECATFYTKQLAQHAAMGILEDEQLENAIVVTMH